MASLTIHVDGNGTTQNWSVSDYTNIDDPEEVGETPTGGTGNRCEADQVGDSTDVCEWTTGDIPSTSGATTTNFRVWVYDSAGTIEAASTDCRINAAWHGANSGKDGSSGQWDYWDFAASHSIASGMSGIEVRMTAPTMGLGDFIYPAGVYIEVQYTGGAAGGFPKIGGTRIKSKLRGLVR